MFLIFFCFGSSFDGNNQEFKTPSNDGQSISFTPGQYLFECYGAIGGKAYTYNDAIKCVESQGHGGRGAFTQGTLKITQNTQFYVYVGGKGTSKSTGGQSGGLNGGGNSGSGHLACCGGGSGGGSTDIRILENDYTSRIMVAAGGAGAGDSHQGAPGGGLNGFKIDGNGNVVEGEVTQTGGGNETGKGGTVEYGGGGSGGYRGGNGGGGDFFVSEPGQSGNSYISGYSGCSLHSSGYFFTSATMIDGRSATESPNDGNGYVKITKIFECPEGCSECSSGSTCSKCFEGYHIYNGQSCHTTCPRGYYVDSTSSECKECEAGYQCPGNNMRIPCNGDRDYSSSGADQCSTCDTGTKPNTEHSGCNPIKCSSGQYLDGNDCLRCEAGFNCPGDNTRIPCDGERQYSKANANQCSTCPTGEKANEDHSGCEQIICNSGQYLDVNDCLGCEAGCQCPGNNSKYSCSGTREYSFANSSSCSTCNTGTKPNTEHTGCQPIICGDGKYLEGNNCVDCSSHCSKCTNSNTCQQCETDYKLYLKDQRCYFSCPTGTYESKGNCYDCATESNCATCPNDASICGSCKEGYYLYEGKCLATCPPAYYANSETKMCIKCEAGYFCSGDNQKEYCGGDNEYSEEGSTECKNCSTGTKPVNLHTECGNINCSAGAYLSGSVCENCFSNCLSCKDGSTCSKCFEGYLLYNENQCLTTCPEGTYISGNNCYDCATDSHCAACPNNPSTCTTCELGYYLYNGQCLRICPGGYYADNTASECKECEAGYQCPGNNMKYYCSGIREYSGANKDKCSTCDTGTKPNEDHSGCEQIICNSKEYLKENDCLGCEAGFYCPGGNDKYECSGNREYSFVNSSSCSTCPTGEKANEKHSGCNPITCNSKEYLVENDCLGCEAGYRCPGNNSKYPCSGIREYSKANEDKCSTCETGKEPNEQHSGCDQIICNSGQYLDVNDCLGCEAGYRCPGDNSKYTCSGIREYSKADASQCSTCSTGTKPNDEHTGCEPIICQDGKYLTGNNCVDCSSHCSKCTNFSTCQKCENGTALYKNQCYETCPDGTYLDESLSQCKECQGKCKKCESDKKCLECNDAYYLLDLIEPNQAGTKTECISEEECKNVTQNKVHYGISKNIFPKRCIKSWTEPFTDGEWDGVNAYDTLLIIFVIGTFYIPLNFDSLARFGILSK